MRSLLALGLAGLCLVLPAAAEAQQADDYHAGVADRLAGRNADAERLLEGWLATHPTDVDAQVQLGYAELALGKLDAAEAAFHAVLAAAPDYKDASDGLALVASRRTVTATAARPSLAIEGSWSDLNHGARDWYEAGARVTAPVDSLTTIEGGGTYYRRFGIDDFELAGSVTHRAGDNVWLRLQASGTPNADFRPKFGIGGGLDWRLHGGSAATVLTFDARYEDFPLQHVTTLSPGLVQYLAGGRAWITARAFGVIPQGRDLQLGWMLRGDFAPAERYRLFAGVADGPDTDLGIVTQVTSVFGGIEVPLGQRFGLTTSVAREWRDVGSDRTELRMGLKIAL